MVHTSGPLPAVKEPTVGWLELFYDLTMVATVVIFSLASTRSPDLLHVAWFVGAFALVWWAWLCTTLTMNVHRQAGGTAQGLIVLQMIAMIYMAALLADPVQSHDHFILPLYGVVMLLIAALNEWLRRHEATSDQTFVVRRRNAFAVSGLCWIAASVVGGLARLLLCLAALVVMVTPLVWRWFNQGITLEWLDAKHIGERFALLTMLVLGESFIKVASATAEQPVAATNAFCLGIEMLMIFAVWLAYFRDIVPEGVPSGVVARRVWMFAHLLLQISLVGVAIGLGIFLKLGDSSPIRDVDIIALTTPLALVFIFLCFIGTSSAQGEPGLVELLRLACAVGLGVIGWATWRFTAITVDRGLAAMAAIMLGTAGLTHRLLSLDRADLKSSS